jgi:hypothetical protein
VRLICALGGLKDLAMKNINFLAVSEHLQKYKNTNNSN